VIGIRTFVVLAAAAILGLGTSLGAHAEPTVDRKSEDRPAAAQSGGFKQDVKRAWSETRANAHRAGREIRDGARAAGRATADAFRSGWRKVKEGFAGTPERAGPGGTG